MTYRNRYVSGFHINATLMSDISQPQLHNMFGVRISDSEYLLLVTDVILRNKFMMGKCGKIFRWVTGTRIRTFLTMCLGRFVVKTLRDKIWRLCSRQFIILSISLVASIIQTH